jgi:hypothetical protein
MRLTVGRRPVPALAAPTARLVQRDVHDVGRHLLGGADDCVNELLRRGAPRDLLREL